MEKFSKDDVILQGTIQDSAYFIIGLFNNYVILTAGIKTFNEMVSQ
jgi:hypothetical protein